MEKNPHLTTLINKYLPATIDTVPDSLPEEEWEEAIRLRVKQLLNSDLERLLTMLYRVDVSEESVKHLLATADPDVLDLALAQTIIARLKQKLLTRKKYGVS